MEKITNENQCKNCKQWYVSSTGTNYLTDYCHICSPFVVEKFTNKTEGWPVKVSINPLKNEEIKEAILDLKKNLNEKSELIIKLLEENNKLQKQLLENKEENYCLVEQ